MFKSFNSIIKMFNYIIYLIAFYCKHANNLPKTKINAIILVTILLPITYELPSNHALVQLGSTVHLQCTPLHLYCLHTYSVHTLTYTHMSLTCQP